MIKSIVYNMNLKNKLYVVFGISIVAILIGVTFGVASFSRVQVGGKVYREIEQNMLIADNIAKLRANLSFVRAALLNLVIEDSNDRRQSLRAEIDDLSSRIEELFDEIEGQMADTGQAEAAASVKTAREAWTAFKATRDRDLIPMVMAGRLKEAMALARGIQAERYTILASETKKAVDHVRADVPDMVAKIKRESSLVQIAYIIGSILFILFFCALALFFSRTIVAPVVLVSDRSQRMAQGDFTLNGMHHGRGKDEIGVMMQSFAAMVAKVGDTVGRLKMSIMNLSSSSEELSATAESLSRGAVQQTHQAKEVASATTQMSQTISDVAQNAVQAAEAAKNSSEAATGGKEIVAMTAERLATITETVKETSQTIETLSRSSEQIGEIVNLIHTIADQTNLLALNAAIEAARAGEQGKGFAVVADEVRKLADRTTTATKDIEQKISAIQTEAEKSLAAVNKGYAEVEKGVGLAKSASESLDTIVKASTQVLDMVQRIAVATEEQSAAAEEITRNMGTISEVTDQSSESTNQIQQAARSLAQLALEIQNSMAWFKTESRN
jgi:methyl-accepting chemotaxis protein